MEEKAKLRVGLVGCGWHGASLAEAVVRSRSLRLVACADPDQAAASRAAALAPDVSTHASIEALLAESEVDAVLIATPHHLLAPLSLTALRAGKHVMAEKPIALNEREAEAVEQMAAASGVTYMAGYSMRFSMGRYVHELLAAGAVGEIRAITGSIGCGALDDDWIASPETGGGPLLFIGCHLIDLMLWYVGNEPREVYANIEYRADTGADKTSALQIRFANDALAQCLVTQAASTFFYEVDIHGAAGKIALRARNFLQFEVEVSSQVLDAYREPTIIRPSIRRDNITMMLVPELEDFARAVREQRPPAVTASDGRLVLRVLDAAKESARTRQPVLLSETRAKAF